jgi:hypothetical protein
MLGQRLDSCAAAFFHAKSHTPLPWYIGQVGNVDCPSGQCPDASAVVYWMRIQWGGALMNGESDEIRSERQPGSMIGAGVAIGAGFGVSLGLVLGNLALGIAIGVAIGTAIGVSLSEQEGAAASTETISRGARVWFVVGLSLILLIVAAGIVLLLMVGAG